MAADDLCTLAEVREFTKRPAGDTSDDDRITSAIEYVTSAIKSWCHRDVLYNPSSATSVTEFLDGNGQAELVLREWPILSVTSVHESADRAYDAGDLLVEDTDFLAYDEEGMLLKLPDGPGASILTGGVAGEWTPGARTIKVVYVPGYTAIPTPLKLVCLQETTKLVNQARAKGLTRVQRSLSTEDFNVTAWLPESKRLLGPYRSVRV